MRGDDAALFKQKTGGKVKKIFAIVGGKLLLKSKNSALSGVHQTLHEV